MSSECYMILGLGVPILLCQRPMPHVHSTLTSSLIECKLFIPEGLDLAIGWGIKNMLELSVSDLLSK